jgi:hypothetical protein
VKLLWLWLPDPRFSGPEFAASTSALINASAIWNVRNEFTSSLTPALSPRRGDTFDRSRGNIRRWICNRRGRITDAAAIPSPGGLETFGKRRKEF